MALDFPASPTVGDIYSYNEYSWQWNGIYWESYSTNYFLPISGGTVTGSTTFTAGLLSSTISATTYDNLPSFNFAQINGVTQFSAETNNYINFSGINLTITSASTNTLVLSAGTGGGGSGTISGTVNYIPKFTSSSSIGNSVMTNINNTVYITGSTGDTPVFYVDNNGKGSVAEFRCVGTNANQQAIAGFAGSGTSQIGVYGQGGPNQYGVYGLGQGDFGTVIGVYGRGGYTNSPTGATYIGGYFLAPDDFSATNSYAVQLYDGSAGINKVLVSKTFDGKANWSDSLTGLTLVSSATISATTYQNIPISAVTNGAGISATTSNGVSTISNTQIQGITGKTDGAGISSSISNNVITITNTGVTSLTTSTGISGNSTIGAVTLQLSASSYSMFANNTASAGVPSQVTYKDTGDASFSAIVTWGTTTPSIAGEYRYRWFQVGNVVWFYFNWTSSALGAGAITWSMPSDMPNPAIPTGFNVALYVLHRYMCSFGNAQGGPTSGTVTLGATALLVLRRNATNTAWEWIIPSTTQIRWFSATGHYFV